MVRVKMSEIDSNLTDEELREIEAANTMPVVYDEDSPEMTDKMLREFHSFDAVPIRISRDALKRVKEYDKDYTSFLSRLLDLALHDNDLIKKCIP